MFKFRLEKVLGHRARLEESAKAVYVERRAQRVAGEREIERIQDRRFELARTLADSVSLRLNLGLNFAKLDDDERSARIALGVLLDEEAAAERAWIQAKRDLQVIEKLREKAYQEWQLEDARRTQNALDEWAVLRRAA